MSKSVALVTGGAGFIGSALVRELVSQGWKVRVLDNFSTGHRENLAGALNEVQLIEGDVADLNHVRSAMEGVQFVFHQAANPSVP